MFGLEGFGWASWWSPFMLLSVIVVAALYLYFTGPGRVHFEGSEPVPLGKKLWFLSGLLFLYAAFGSPIDLLGHLMFSFHMTAMVLAYIAAAPMLLVGTPEWMLLPLGKIPGVRRLKFLINPIMTLLMFNLAFSLYHVPLIHDYVMTNFFVHTLYYILLMITAILMWFPIICPISKIDKLEGFKKMGYIFANSVLLTPACALIIFSDSAMYATYTDPQLWAVAMGYCVPQGAAALLEMFSGPQSLSWMDPVADQAFGGIIMKLAQEVVYGSILIYVFKQWYKKENPNQEDKDSMEPTEAYYERYKPQADPVN